MALRDLTPPVTRKGPLCTVCLALRGLPDDDAAQLTKWLADENVTFAGIAEACRNDPDTPDLSATALSRHAKGVCGSGKRLR